jgi:hypothetical protein
MYEGLTVLMKIVLTALLSPVVYHMAMNFREHVGAYPSPVSDFFLWGVFGFVLVFLFAHQFRPVHQAGQGVLMFLFQMIRPLDRPIARVIPFYTVMVLAGYYAAGQFFNIGGWEHYFIFFAGFGFAMHIVLLAQELQEEEASFLRLVYFFRMSLYFIFNVCLMVFLLDWAVWKFTFFDFVSAVFADARDTYLLTVRMIF